MAKQKVKFKEHVSPIGVAKMAFLDKPSAPYEGKGDPQYKTRILLEDTKENREWIDGVIETALAEAKTAGVKMKKVWHNPFIMPEDVDEDDFEVQDGKTYPKYDEDHRGKIIFEAKSKYKPGLIDTARQSLPDDVKIYGDDTIRMKVQATPYLNGSNSGITLRLVTVQLIEKNANYSGGGAPSTDGFDDVDGYVAPSGESEGDEDF